MSLRTLLGPRRPILTETPEAARLLTLKSFFVYPSTVVDLLESDGQGFGCARLDATFPIAEGPAGLKGAVERLGDQAEQLAAEGTGIIVIDDGAIDAERTAVPALLATGAVHHRLVPKGLRM